MKFKDIPQFTQSAGYHITVDWRHLETQLQSWAEKEENLGGLDMDPEFQRAHVWTEEQQRNYVEFVLRGGQSSRNILWNAKGWMRTFEGNLQLVDGKQRLEAARKFLRNELAVFNGHYLKDFEDRMPSHCQFIFHVNDLSTQEEVLQWYLEINTGGTPHTTAEIQKVKNMLGTLRQA